MESIMQDSFDQVITTETTINEVQHPVAIVTTQQDTQQDAEQELPIEEASLLPIVGPNCRINIIDRHEIERLNQDLDDLQRWFEDYGHDGILFPNSIINAFAPLTFSQAA